MKHFDFGIVPITKFLLPKNMSIQKYLRTRHFSKISQGGYAEIFSHKKYPNKVLKVLSINGDLSYMKYLEFCCANQDSAFVPKVFAIYIIQGNVKYCAVVLEKLRAYNSRNNVSFQRILENILNLVSNKQSHVAITEFSSFCLQFSKFYEEHKLQYDFSLDLHNANIMLRGKTPVVTDPIE